MEQPKDDKEKTNQIEQADLYFMLGTSLQH